MSILTWVGVVLLGGMGAVLRFLVDRSVGVRLGRAFPFGMLTVNVTGAAILGLLSGLALNPDAALVAGTAAVGSYTTFSTWMLETERAAEERRWPIAAANIVVSVVLGLAAALAGQTIGAYW